jgi:DNA polymerase I-like protein with 3'-5' exonuclease and polymerase domains
MTGALGALRRIEMPLVRVLAAMEGAGVALDRSLLAAQRGPLEKAMDQLQVAVCKAAGVEVKHMDSAAELADVLYKRLGLVAPPGTKMLR